MRHLAQAPQFGFIEDSGDQQNRHRALCAQFPDCSRSTMKSLRSTGISTAARAASRSLQPALKIVLVRQHERQARRRFVVMSEERGMEKSANKTPRLGELS